MYGEEMWFTGFIMNRANVGADEGGTKGKAGYELRADVRGR